MKLKYNMVVIKSAWMDTLDAVKAANALKAKLKRNCVNKHVKCFACTTVSDVAPNTGFYGVNKAKKLKRGRPKREYLGNENFDWRVPHLHILIMTDNIYEVKKIIKTFFANRYGDHLTDFYSEDISDKFNPVMEYVIRQACIVRSMINDESDYNFQKRYTELKERINAYRKSLVLERR